MRLATCYTLVSCSLRFSTLKMEVILSSETSVHTRTTRRYIPEVGSIQILHSFTASSRDITDLLILCLNTIMCLDNFEDSATHLKYVVIPLGVSTHRLRKRATQNYWSPGLRPSFGILNTRKHSVSETGSVCFLR
jgi:hypothetical protein